MMLLHIRLIGSYRTGSLHKGVNHIQIVIRNGKTLEVNDYYSMYAKSGYYNSSPLSAAGVPL